MLIGAVEQAGLTGRGGAAFPVHRKLSAVARGRGRKVIVANGAESEPASRKDALLLRAAPNLVLDGLQLAAEAIGASEAHLYLHAGRQPGPQPGPGPAIRRRPGFRPGQDHRSPAAVSGRPGIRAGQPAGRGPRGARLRAAAGVRARPGRRADLGAERGDAGPPGPDRAVRPALVPRAGHRRGAGQHARHRAHQGRRPGHRGRNRRPAADPAARWNRRPGRAHRRLPRHLAARRAAGHAHPGQPVAAAARRRARRRPGRGAARRPVRPGRSGPGGPLPGRRVSRPVRSVPQRAARDGGRAR